MAIDIGVGVGVGADADDIVVVAVVVDVVVENDDVEDDNDALRAVVGVVANVCVSISGDLLLCLLVSLIKPLRLTPEWLQFTLLTSSVMTSSMLVLA